MVSAAPAQPNSPTEPNNNDPAPDPLILKPSPKPSPSSPGDGLKIYLFLKASSQILYDLLTSAQMISLIELNYFFVIKNMQKLSKHLMLKKDRAPSSKFAIIGWIGII